MQESEYQPKSSGKLIGELSRAALIYFQNEFKQYNIGHAQVRTLHFISQHEGLTPMELAYALNLDKSSITSQLKILEANGYISRHTSEKDARMQQIFITDKTKNILVPIKSILKEWTETLMIDFSPLERDEIYKYLERMRDNAKNKIESIKNKK